MFAINSQNGMMSPTKGTFRHFSQSKTAMSFARSALVITLFIPAILGLIIQAWKSDSLSQCLVALACLCLIPEQAHMAIVDLRHIALAQGKKPDSRLQPFHQQVCLTISGQLLGFYLAAAGWLALGMFVLLGSLIGFNLIAAIRLEPDGEDPVVPWGVIKRLDVLALDGLALALVVLWLFDYGQLYTPLGIFTLAAVYVVSKLIAYLRAWQSINPLTSHPPDSAE